MKKIARSIDEETLALVDELYGSSRKFRSRSALIRFAIREYAGQMTRRLEDGREREIIRKNKILLDRQLKALITEQAHEKSANSSG